MQLSSVSGFPPYTTPHTGSNVPVNQKQSALEGQTSHIYSCSDKIVRADVQELNPCTDTHAERKPRKEGVSVKQHIAVC